MQPRIFRELTKKADGGANPLVRIAKSTISSPGRSCGDLQALPFALHHQ
jgi:hypothetical protein